MRREQIQLIALTLAPPLLVVLLSLTLLYRRPDTTDLWLAVTATVLVLAASIILYRKLWRNVFTPLEQLAQDVTAIEPGLPLHSQSSLMEQLVIAIEQRLSDLSSTRPSETESLAENALHLENTVGKNKPAHTGRDLNKHGMRTETLVAATEEPLSKIIACTNLLTASGAHQDLTRRLFAAAQGFTFLARELANVDYSSELPTSFDIRQVNDEVIASLGPLLSEGQRILSFFDEFGPKRFIANRSLIGALLFNFFLDRLPRTAAALELEVGYLTEDSLVFRLAPSIGHQEPSIRFTELATALGATLGDDILSIPVNVDHAFRQPETRLTATIFSNDTRQLESLSSRLASMRVNVLGEDYNAHVCIATIDDVAAIELLRTRLAPQSHLLLLSNTRLMHLPNTRQLDNPLQHEALAQTLYELTDIEGSDTPMVLVVDGNAANSRLLSLHLNDLGVSVETAEDGATAIALVDRHRFALVMVDMHLPDAKGMDIAKAIRETEMAPPVAMLASPIAERPDSDNDIVGVLVKPVSPAALGELLVGLDVIPQVPALTSRPLAASRSTILPVFDPALALKLANNRSDAADNLLESFMASIESRRESLDASFHAGDMAAFRRHLQQISDGVRYCGFPRFKHSVSRLEALLRESEISDLGLALSVFNAEVDSLVKWYDPMENYFDTSMLHGRPVG